MHFLHNRFIPVTALLLSLASTSAVAQTPDYSNVGRAPTEAEIKSWDISISLDGKELPPGKGTSKEGAAIFATKCAACHGQNLQGSPLGPALVGGKGTLASSHPIKTVGSYWPFATSVWDYINRAMPHNQGGTLTADEVYSLTAFIFFRNDIIREDDVMDAKSLPKIQMPNRNGFIPQDLKEIHDTKKRGCRLGTCP